jgi:nitroimidazol reductase NimA-like FMN-containing flavoprotein (pyridoxamine 5'-phosphate oxidase superfamily)
MKINYAKRECTDEAKITALLTESRVGIIGFSDNGMPYAVPVNFVWHEGAVYFHGMGSGRKVELLSHAPPVCFTVYRERGTVTDPVPCHADTSYISVMVFGKAERLTDHAMAADALQRFIEKFLPGHYATKLNGSLTENYRSSLDGNAVAVYRIAAEEITAKENAAQPETP